MEKLVYVVIGHHLETTKDFGLDREHTTTKEWLVAVYEDVKQAQKHIECAQAWKLMVKDMVKDGDTRCPWDHNVYARHLSRKNARVHIDWFFEYAPLRQTVPGDDNAA